LQLQIDISSPSIATLSGAMRASAWHTRPALPAHAQRRQPEARSSASALRLQLRQRQLQARTSSPPQQRKQHSQPWGVSSAWPRPQHASRAARLACRAFAAPASLPRDSVDYNGSAFSYLPDFSSDLSSAPLGAAPQPLPRAVEGAVDDPRLHNPLQRQERLGTGWMGAIIEYEGIVSPCRFPLPACVEVLLVSRQFWGRCPAWQRPSRRCIFER